MSVSHELRGKAIAVKLLFKWTTMPEITEATGMHWQSTLRFITALESQELLEADKSGKPYRFRFKRSLRNGDDT